MKQTNTLQRTWWSAVGVATAASTIVAGWAPVAHAAPAAPQRDNALRQQAAAPADGTYESCGAYFGYGKNEFDVLDIVAFDVTDQNGSDGASHAVGTDTQVVLELKNNDGDVLECTPVEVTQEMWDSVLAENPLSDIPISPDHPLPAWPGPGHYIYPTVNFETSIVDFGVVTSVGFKVVAVPGNHTLVSPTAVQPLAVHYPDGTVISSVISDPLVLAYIASTAGPAAEAAFEDALISCDPLADLDPDLIEAVLALGDYLGFGGTAENVDCESVGYVNAQASFFLGFTDTVNYREPIVLSVPETPATNPPTVNNVATPATPVTVQPTYTG